MMIVSHSIKKSVLATLKDALRQPIAMKLTEEGEKVFKSASVCHICNKPATDKDALVRDHCHLVGTIRGAARYIIIVLIMVV